MVESSSVRLDQAKSNCKCRKDLVVDQVKSSVAVAQFAGTDVN